MGGLFWPPQIRLLTMLWSFEKDTILTPYSKNLTLQTYEHNRLDERSIVDRHRCHMAVKLGLFVDEDHSKLPTIYSLPTLHKRPYKSRFIANSSACTTTELSILLTSCLTAIKKMSLNIAQQFMKEMVTIYFGLLKTQVKLFIN